VSARIEVSRKVGPLAMKRAPMGEVLLVSAPGFTTAAMELLEAADPAILYRRVEGASEHIAFMGINGAADYVVTRYDLPNREVHLARREVRDDQARFVAGPWPGDA
jgi:hypothetical protein